ncbi:hypothetical protein [Streptomyces sp. NPDC058451]|uniref:hypothetical protein n=1 Tax=Streptomyces sp. NPDC058451 TaxID=3346506 RepID=UPI003657CF2F
MLNVVKLPGPAWVTTAVAALGGVLLLVAAPLMQARLDALTQGAKSDGERARQQSAAIQSMVGNHRRFPLVSEVNNRALLGIHPSIPLPADASEGLSSELPTYVPRDVDADLHAAMRRTGMAGGFVLLVGHAATGKTRCAYEAIRTLFGDWRFCMPSSAEQLTALVDSGANLMRTVVWLNETQRFLGPGRLKVETMRRILADPKQPVVIVGTIWPSEYNRLMAREAVPDPQDFDDSSREILKLARRFTVKKFSGSEAQRAQELAPADPRLAEAVAHEDGSNLTEFLSAAPELIDRWEQAADPFGAAIISAGIGARRCGHPEPLPAGLLKALAAAHLSGAQRAQASEAWLTDALRWACEPVRGAASPLIPDAAQIGHLDGYRVSDILVQHTQRNTALAPLPESQWNLLVDHANPLACLSIGSAAYAQGRTSPAESAWRRAAEDGITYAATRLGFLLFDRGDVEEARLWWDRAVAADGPVLAAAIGHTVFIRGDVAEARAWWERSLAGGDRATAAAIGQRLFEEGDPEEARAWWDRAVELGGRRTAAAIGNALFERNEIEEARVWWERAVAAGGFKTAVAIGDGLSERGDAEEARLWWERAVADGGSIAAISIGTGLFERGDAEEARTWWERAVAAGGPAAAVTVGDGLSERGDFEEARVWWERAVTDGGPSAAVLIGHGLSERGDFEEARVWWERAVTDGGPSAAVLIGHGLIELGQVQEARVWWERAVTDGSRDARHLIEELQRRPDQS